jgi:hypothetical protein
LTQAKPGQAAGGTTLSGPYFRKNFFLLKNFFPTTSCGENNFFSISWPVLSSVLKINPSWITARFTQVTILKNKICSILAYSSIFFQDIVVPKNFITKILEFFFQNLTSQGAQPVFSSKIGKLLTVSGEGGRIFPELRVLIEALIPKFRIFRRYILIYFIY